MEAKKFDRGIERSAGSTKIFVENIKCGGCGATISKEMKQLGFADVTVDPQENTVSFAQDLSSEELGAVVSRLRSLGYPLVDSEEGLAKLALKAKSFASCAIGKWENRQG